MHVTLMTLLVVALVAGLVLGFVNVVADLIQIHAGDDAGPRGSQPSAKDESAVPAPMLRLDTGRGERL